MIRTDKWPLQATAQQKELMRLTLHEYRAFCRAVSIIILNNWPALCQADSFCAATERLIHPTAKNPETRHTYFQKRFYKFPSYLRRAAIEFAKGLLAQRENVRCVQTRNVRFNGVNDTMKAGEDDDHDEPTGSKQAACA